MAGALTKADLAEKLYEDLGLNKREAKEIVEMLFNEISETLQHNEQVKLSGFGNFDLRDKGERPGRNPKTGEEIPISARRVVTFKPGQKVMLMWASANRDEREFDAPDEYRMERRPPRMLAFGHGTHLCLGKHVALLEARLALTELMKRIPDYEIDIDAAKRNRTEFVQGWIQLPARWETA